MKKLLIVLLVLIVLLIAVGFFTPTDYTIERKITIQATPEAVHEFVGDLQKWPAWNPWDELDDSIRTTLGEKTKGVGAHQSWTSDNGDGDLTFTASDPKSGIAYDMAFIQDGKRSPAKSTMTYRAIGSATEVSWTMEGNWKGAVPAVVAGWMKLLSPYMIGPMFDKGLENLKTQVEAAG